MGGGDGLEALAALKREHPQTSVVMLTAYEDPSYLARAVAGGAAGYLLKGVGRHELLSALRAVVQGESLIGPDDLARTVSDVERSADSGAGKPGSAGPLSEREVEVLKLVASGQSNPDIAAALFVSEETVKSHVKNIIRKLRVSDRVQAAVWGARHGLLGYGLIHIADIMAAH